MYDKIENRFIYPDTRPIPDEYMDETFEYIPEITGYMVSNKGRVWSEKSQKFLKPKKLDKAGHLGFSFSQKSHDGKHYTKYKYLHRIMAESMIPNPHNHPIVRHLDDNRDNNELENLAWGTPLDNHYDSVANGTHKPFNEKCWRKSVEKCRVPVEAKNLKTGKTRRFRSKKSAGKFLGVEPANIHKVLTGERTHTGGYTFRRLEK